jgi:hypothetical protein
MTRDEILKKIEEKEYVKRCLAVNICPACGRDLRDISALSSHWTELACPNKKCEDYGKVRKSWT